MNSMIDNIEIEVEDELAGHPRIICIDEFNCRRVIKPIIAADPDDDQIGDPGGFEDVVCRWKDTGAYFTDADWDNYMDTIYDALNDYVENSERGDSHDEDRDD